MLNHYYHIGVSREVLLVPSISANAEDVGVRVTTYTVFSVNIM